MKKKVLVSSLLTIALCFSLIVGATFALFTSNTGVNVAVSSGKVEVVATAENITHTSVLGNTVDGTYAKFVEGTNTVDLKILPGDTVTFVIKVTNNSDVSIKYRTIIACEADDGLFSGLVVNVGGKEYHGTTAVSAYTALAAGETVKEDTVKVTVSLPKTAGDEYNGKSCTFSYKVEAVQGNAETEDPDLDNTVYIYNANDLMTLSGTTRSNTAKKEVIEFINDINMDGKAWEAFEYYENLTVKGNGHTITGLCQPLIKETYWGCDISDLTIKNSTMALTNKLPTDQEVGFGAFICFADALDADEYIKLTNCHLDNVTMSTKADRRLGGFVGYISTGNLTLDGCTVKNSTLEAFGSVGGLVGHTIAKTSLQNCQVNNTTINSTDDGGWRVGTFVGTADGECYGNNSFVNITNCKVDVNDGDNTTLTQTGKTPSAITEFGRLVNNGKVIVDGKTAYATAAHLGYAMKPTNNTITLNYNYVIVADSATPANNIYTQVSCTGCTVDGQNHSISGLTAPLFATNSNNTSISNLTLKDATISYNDLVYWGLGAFIGSTNGGGEVVFTNCHIDNVEVANDTYTGTAGFIGASSDKLTFNNCTATNCTVNAKNNGAVFVGLYQSSSLTVDNCKAENCKVSSEDDGGWRVGAVVGTVTGSGQVTISSFENSGVSLSMPKSTATNPNHALWGRNADTTGNASITIDGRVVSGTAQ